MKDKRSFDLYDYQLPHARMLMESLIDRAVAKDGSDTGTGKTPVACWVAEGLKAWGVIQNVLVVCPKAVMTPWREWLDKTSFAGTDQTYDIVNWEMVRTGRTPFGRRHRSRSRWLFEWTLAEETLIIFDEDHYAKGAKTQNASLVSAATAQRFTHRIATLLIGATSCSNPLEMGALGYALGLHRGPKDWYKWALRHGCRKNHWNALEFNHNPEVLEYIRDHIYGSPPDGSVPYGSRMSIQDLGDEFPEGHVSVDAYDFPALDEINSAYEEMVKLSELEDLYVDADNPLTESLRLRQQIEICKLPVFEEMTRDLHAEGKSVVLFVNFRDTLEMLVERLKDLGVSEIHGGQTQTERDAAIKVFQEDNTRICICTLSAGGVGVSLHDVIGKYPRVSIISPNFSAIQFKQALGRIHRANAMTPAVQKVIFAAGTVEERIRKNLTKKLNDLDTVNDSDFILTA
tara:strand:- start:548 stop:1921 length:1374 start_codon:yes stop_codon:yes gene_type:complete